MAFDTKVTIAGTDVTSYVITYTVTDTVEDITPAQIALRADVLSLVSLTQEQEVVITRGGTTSTDNTIFRGFTSSIKKVSGVNINIEAFDKLWKLQRVTLTKTYDINIDPEAGVISAIAEDLIETFGGLTADVEATGSVNVLQKFIIRGDGLLDKLKQLAEIVDYWVYYDPDADTVNFKSRGFTTFGTNLQVGTNLTAVPLWNYDYTQIANNVTLKGDYQEFETTETDTGDGLETEYTLTFKPESIKVFVNSVLQTGGVPGQASTFDYSVDKENKKITFEVAPPNTQPIEFQYSYLQPIKLTQQNPTSIAAFGNYSVTKDIETIQTLSDAEEKIQEILNKFSGPIVKASSVKVFNVFGMQAGQKVTIIDGVNDESRDVFIREIRYSYPDIIDDIRVDNEPLFQDYVLKNAVRKRIERLERRNESDSDLLISRFSFSRFFKPRRRYMQLQRSKIFDSFVFNHPINGVMGVGQILEGFDSSSGSWTPSAGITLADDASTVQVGAGSLKHTFTSTGSQTITSTQSFGNLSNETGVGTGTPTQGTCGIWWNSPNTTGITAVKMRLGSSASNYIECTGREYRTVDGYNNWSSLAFGLINGWNYFLFDLDNPDSTVGTPDWGAVDYTRFEYTVASTHVAYIDYFTISSSNFIGANGLGDRSQVVESAAKLVQGNLVYDEFVYDTTFHDSVNSTATFNTGTNTISFTSGQIWISEAIDVGTVLDQIQVDLGDTTGSFTLEISSDNKATFQTLTEGALTTVTSSDGTGTYIRITESAAAAATITNTTDTFGQNTDPAVKVTMIVIDTS